MAMRYEEVQQKFNEARNKQAGKPIANNTRVVDRGNGVYAIQLHATDILTYHPDGGVEYNTGGWRTITTKQRMNEFGPARVWSTRGTWYISIHGWNSDSEPSLYDEHCIVLANGTIIGTAEKSDAKKEQQLRKRVGEFAQKYVKQLVDRKMEKPGPGDCWYCCLREVKTGKPLGEQGGRPSDHIESHINDSYLVPSLIWNAMEAMGASQAMRYDVAVYQGLTEGKPWISNEGWGHKQLTKVVRRYCLRELGLAY